MIGLKIQAYMNDSSREYIDKADIQSLIRQHAGMDWERVKKYADLFDQWHAIEEIRKKT